MSTEKVVLGIHGLLNKPPHEHLQRWWKLAIDEGLKKNAGSDKQFMFDLVYWADVRNKKQQAIECFESGAKPETCIVDPYIEHPGSIIPHYKGGRLQGIRDSAQRWFGLGIDREKDLFGIGTNVEHLLGITLDDLDEYYQNETIRTAIRNKLKATLEKHKNSSVLLLAHSMGSIIAYDVLRELHKEDPQYKLSHLVTLGSPLGLPLVSKKIRTEFGCNTTPENVLRWSNCSDPEDKVALDCQLNDEYDELQGIIVIDHYIRNSYVDRNGDSNNHKSYGYLRAPEVSKMILSHLES